MEQLNLFEMQEISGGKVCTKKEYCATLETSMAGMIKGRRLKEYRLADEFYQEHCVD